MADAKAKVNYAKEILGMDNAELKREYAANSKRFIEALVAYSCSLDPGEMPLQALGEIAEILRCKFQFENKNTKVYISGVARGVQMDVRTTDASGKENIFRTVWNGLKGTFQNFLDWIAKVLEAIKKAFESFINGFKSKNKKAEEE